MLKKTIIIDGKQVPMRASASTPRLYRIKFGRDLIKDMQSLQTKSKSNEEFTVEDLTVFENLAFLMAYTADVDENGNHLGNVPNSVEDWLDGFDGLFDIYEALPQIFELWGLNVAETSTAKKKINK